MKKQLPRKIIYFDETSAVDLLQIQQKGNLTRTIESIKKFSGELDGNLGAKIDTDSGNNIMGALKHISGIASDFHSKLGTNGSINGSRIARTVIENSLLYDFLEAAESRRGKPLLNIEEGYSLSIPKDSMTYFATIAPLTEMMEGNQSLDNPEISMSISKMNSGIKGSKGYYELIGKLNDDSPKVVFRFNIDTFKNNYRIQDLPKMNLVLYAIEVGTTSLSQLNFETEFNIETAPSEVEFKGLSEHSALSDPQLEEPIKVLDVLLAGVR